MSFEKPRFTNAGKALQLRSIGGTQICFTRMKVGDGIMTSGLNYKEFTDLINPKADLVLTGIRVEDGYAAVRGYFSNSGVTEGFNYRELGLFAQNPDDPTQEVLYCYANYGDDYVYIAEPESEVIERSVTIYAIVDDAENVTAILDSSAVYIDAQMLAAAIATHNADPTAHPDIDMPIAWKKVYIDENNEEAYASRDGTREHPYRYLDEAVDKNPPNQIAKLHVVALVPTGNKHISTSDNSEFRCEDYIAFSLSTDSVDRGVLVDVPCIFEKMIDLQMDLMMFETGDNPGYNVGITRVQNVSFKDCDFEFSDVESADDFALISASYCDSIDFYRCTFSAPDSNNCRRIYADNCGFVYVAASCSDSQVGGFFSRGFDGAYSTFISLMTRKRERIELYDDTTCMLINAKTAACLTDGTFVNHFTNYSNPHRVTLSQAAAAGGILDVAHGGTGKSTHSVGAILLGNGSNPVQGLSGIGAVYKALADSGVHFGTLPISCGGTGTDAPIWENSSQSAEDTAVGSLTIGKVCIQWGVANVDHSIGDHGVDVYFHQPYKNAYYSISGFEYGKSSGSLTRSTDHFHVESATALDLDFFLWITIGFIS